MPKYMFTCTECGETFSDIVDGNEREVDCPQCGSTAERDFSYDVSLRFKGHGFYRTDYNEGDQ